MGKKKKVEVKQSPASGITSRPGRNKTADLVNKLANGYTLTDRETAQISEEKKARANDKFIAENAKYWDGIINDEPTRDAIVLNAKSFFEVVKYLFKASEGKELILDENSKADLLPLIYYFSRDSRFLALENVLKNTREPSFDKGLLIVGVYGNGKSSYMRAILNALLQFPTQSKETIFGLFTANRCVENYEGCIHSETGKNDFWRSMSRGNKWFDDVKTERAANNFGQKTEVMSEILQKRYEQKSRGGTLTTHITCNYPEGSAGDIGAALAEFGTRYTGRVEDRLSEMFNIIEFKSSSKR